MAKKARADYSYTFSEKGGVKFLLLEDQNIGGVSLTNDIENVVNEIGQAEDISDRIVLYADSEGDWDGWNAGSDTFFHVGGTSADEAIQGYIAKYKTGKA